MKKDEMTLEEAFTALEDMVQKLEERNASLEESFLLYQQGMDLVKLCSKKIDTVEKKMLQINADGEFSEF